MLIDAENLILGRLASFVAKKALLGEKITIVNANKVVVVGRKEDVLAKYKAKTEKGGPLHGPFIPKIADRFLKRTIRGMLPYKQEKGRKAFEKIKCYIGVPEKFKNEKFETIKEANVEKAKTLRFLSIQKICDYLGK